MVYGSGTKQTRYPPERLLIPDWEICHYDTPLTPEHETETLLAAGFSSVEVLNRWEQTYTLKAVR